LSFNLISAGGETVSPERDDYRDEDDREEFASRSIFSAGWFRAVLVLTVLAIVVVISLPYLLNWFEPATPARVAKSAEPLKPTPGAPSPAVAPAPAAPIAAPPEVKPAPPVTPAPKAAIAPPAAPAPAPKAVAEKAIPPASSEPARKAIPEKAPAKAAAEKPVTKAPAEKAPPKTATERPPTKAAETAPAKTADKPAAPGRVVAKADGPSRPVAVASAKPSAEAASGNYWIQLGAFKDQKNADALAKTLRDAGFPIQVTPIRSGGGGESKGAALQHELFVTETSVDKVNAALKGRGTAQPVSGGVAVKPAFSLQDAMTVSKRLTDEGLKVVIRPASGVVTPSQGQGTLHAVRAGGYSDRTSALAARDELAAKGHPGFLAEGQAK
jgi:cell division septation protein DedD